MELLSFNIICFILMYINIVVGKNWRYDYTYSKKAKGYFKFHQIPATWYDARLRCHLEGAVLVSPYPQNMTAAIIDYMHNIGHMSYNIFIGIHATFSAGDYQTIEGIPLGRIPMKWMYSEPDNNNNAENCLIMSSEGLADDVNCTEIYPYICYKKEVRVDISQTPCGTTDPEYKKSNVTGNCYKFHNVPRTWHNANRACYAEGGYLVIINSNEEAKFVKQLLAEYPENKILGPYLKYIVFAGFYFWNVSGDWRTVHGETFAEAGYGKFKENQPNNLSPGQYCGCIYREHAKYGDYFCDKQDKLLTHVCEKTPDSLLVDEDDN